MRAGLEQFLADESDADGAGLERRRQFIAVSGGGIVTAHPLAGIVRSG